MTSTVDAGFTVLFVFGLFVAPVLIAASALGLFALAVASTFNAEHPRARRVLWTCLVTSSLLALLLGGIVAYNVE